MKILPERKFIFGFIIVMAVIIAMPAWGASGTWTNATDDDKWDTAGNWTHGVPGAGGEADFDGSEAARGLPTVNLLDLSSVGLIIDFLADYSTHDISEFSSGASCSASTVEVGSSGSIRLNVASHEAWASSNGILTIKAATTVAINRVQLVEDGMLQAGGAGAVLDGMVVSTYTPGGNINWTNLSIIGGINAAGHTVTHTNTTEATLTVDQAGNLDLGGDATGLAVNVNALGLTVTAQRNENIYKLTTTDGEFAGNSKTYTIGDGGFAMTGGTISGTFSADLSGSAGVFTQTSGALASGAILNIIAGSGGFSYTNPSIGTLNLIVTSDLSSGIIEGLSANTAYLITVAGTSGTVVSGASCSGNICTSNGSGQVSFSYDGNNSPHVLSLSALSTDATLSNLAISSGTLTPTFASGTTSYTASVANSVESITVTPTVNQANATITVNGTAVTSASASGAISLSVGSNTITTVATAQDGTTTSTYTITVTRNVAPSGSGGWLIQFPQFPQPPQPTVEPVVISQPKILTPAETSAKIAELKQQIIALITQLIQMLTEQLNLVK